MEDISEIVNAINIIRAQRKERGENILDSAMHHIKILSGSFNEWCEKEIIDIKKALELIEKLPTIDLEKIEKLKTELKKIEEEFNDNRESVDSILKSVDEKIITSTYEVNFEDIGRIFAIIVDLARIEDSINKETKNIFDTIHIFKVLMTSGREIPDVMFL